LLIDSMLISQTCTLMLENKPSFDILFHSLYLGG
jgi:hypothetical protein